MKRRLIVNADDFNLTPGVTRGILKAHDQGMVTSTTVLINLPLELALVRQASRRNRLGVGLHLNITLGKPVSPPGKIRSLLKPEGNFRRPFDYGEKKPALGEVIREYEAQIRLFEKRFRKPPDHLDTHHHLHDDPLFFQALSQLARRWKLPVRRSLICLSPERGQAFLPKTTDYLFGSLDATSYWQKDPLFSVLRNLPLGTSEIACHPGFCDRQLRQISSMREAREKELKLFSDRRLRQELARFEIELTNFSQI
ncbi:MAG: ChbG/HpnK family deacetylase [Candidatus Omnitrophica bacterium]|nr:ChbG/HpnK family deacetylase [Candidatus Omnitrophota bacterium]